MILTNNFKIYNQAKLLSQVSKKSHPGNMITKDWVLITVCQI